MVFRHIADHLQSSNFKILSIHDNIIETEEDREPKLDHWIICNVRPLLNRNVEAAIWRLQHDRYDSTEHSNGEQTDLLILAHFAEISYAHSEICKCTISHDLREVLLIQAGHNLECGIRNTF